MASKDDSYKIIKQGGRTAAYVTEFIIDKLEDIQNLPMDTAPGSTCLITTTSEVWIFTVNKEWVKLA